MRSPRQADDAHPHTLDVPRGCRARFVCGRWRRGPAPDAGRLLTRRLHRRPALRPRSKPRAGSSAARGARRPGTQPRGRYPPDLGARLAARGHDVVVGQAWDDLFGHASASGSRRTARDWSAAQIRAPTAGARLLAAGGSKRSRCEAAPDGRTQAYSLYLSVRPRAPTSDVLFQLLLALAGEGLVELTPTWRDRSGSRWAGRHWSTRRVRPSGCARP